MWHSGVPLAIWVAIRPSRATQHDERTPWPGSPLARTACRTRARGERLALGVLRGLAGALEAVLLALLHARVAGEEAGAAQGGAEAFVGAHEGARDAVTHGAGLAAAAAADDFDGDVEAVGKLQQAQGAAHGLHEGLAREVLLGVAAVDGDAAVAVGVETDAGDGGLAAAGAVIIGVRVLRQGGSSRWAVVDVVVGGSSPPAPLRARRGVCARPAPAARGLPRRWAAATGWAAGPGAGDRG